MTDTSTIFALSSGRPPAGVAVVRVSGPAVRDALKHIASGVPPARQAQLRPLRNPCDNSLIDRGLVLFFPGPASFTGEDVAELHVHGGIAVVETLLATLGSLDGLRLAEAGEFTRRAFDNGKLDLTQAEGLSDLIDARTDLQRRQALQQVDGRLRDRAERWRTTLIELAASVEADIDFSDEGDVNASFDVERTAALRDEIAGLLDNRRIGERVRDGLAIAVVGAPNAGKSSLINVLAKRDVAIVSEIAGTTRDAIEVPLDLDGVAATLIDTAGLRETSDPIEQEGIRRARQRAAEADLVLHIVECGDSSPMLGMPVINKIDLSGDSPGVREGRVHLSAKTGEGLADFEAWLIGWAADYASKGEPALVTRHRQRLALGSACEYLHEAIGQADTVLRAEALRLATRELGRVTGRVDVEDVLGEIFGRFCIGK